MVGMLSAAWQAANIPGTTSDQIQYRMLGSGGEETRGSHPLITARSRERFSFVTSARDAPKRLLRGNWSLPWLIIAYWNQSVMPGLT
jgi:hypothetical protein